MNSMSMLPNLASEQMNFLKKLVRHIDRGILKRHDCIEAIVADYDVTPSVAEKMLDQAKWTMTSRN